MTDYNKISTFDELIDHEHGKIGSESRNLYQLVIRSFFNVLTWADEIGSGVKNMNKYVKSYSGGAHPIFIEGNPFISSIPMQTLKIADKYELFIHLSQLSDTQLSAEHVATLKELPLDLSLKNITDIDELAIHLIRHWYEKSGKLHSVRFLLNKQLELDELKKVGSWSEKSGELLKKRARVLLSTLLLTLQPIALEELAIALGYRSKERYRDDYVKPLKDNNLIAYTLEQANDPNQQYLITERGKSFLVGSSI